MPLIFASSLLGLPLALARLTDSAALEGAATALGPGGALYLPVNVALIAFFNYYYTFLQVRKRYCSCIVNRLNCAPAIVLQQLRSSWAVGGAERHSIAGVVGVCAAGGVGQCSDKPVRSLAGRWL
jgi:hypothetical protein